MNVCQPLFLVFLLICLSLGEKSHSRERDNNRGRGNDNRNGNRGNGHVGDFNGGSQRRGDSDNQWDSDTKSRYDRQSRADRERLWRKRHQNERYDQSRFADEYRRNRHQYEDDNDGWDTDTRSRYNRLSSDERKRLWRRKHRNENYDGSRFENEYRQNYRQFDGRDDEYEGRRSQFKQLSRRDRERLWRKRHQNDRYDDNRFESEYSQHSDWYGNGVSGNSDNDWEDRYNRLNRAQRERLWRKRHSRDRYDDKTFKNEYHQHHHDWYNDNN